MQMIRRFSVAACVSQAYDKNFFMRDVRIGTGTLLLTVGRNIHQRGGQAAGRSLTHRYPPDRGRPCMCHMLGAGWPRHACSQQYASPAGAYAYQSGCVGRAGRSRRWLRRQTAAAHAAHQIPPSRALRKQRVECTKQYSHIPSDHVSDITCHQHAGLSVICWPPDPTAHSFSAIHVGSGCSCSLTRSSS
jgi:hypothetical protein